MPKIVEIHITFDHEMAHLLKDWSSHVDHEHRTAHRSACV